jgi:hypothetical protein
LEIKIAREVVAARPQRLQRRIKLCLRLDESAGRRRHAAADGKAHALRLVDNAVALDALEPQHEAVGLLAFVAQFDKARDRNAVSGKGCAQCRLRPGGATLLIFRGFLSHLRCGKMPAAVTKVQRAASPSLPGAALWFFQRRSLLL